MLSRLAILTLRVVTVLALAMLVLDCRVPALHAQSPVSSPSFSNEVLPILTKAGCNSGACHGAATGRGGFRLSLYGQDPQRDWVRIARELGGRRIDWIDPENSLLLRKAGEYIEHGGGLRIEPGSSHWQTICNWIEHGANPDSDLARRLVAITATPAKFLLPVSEGERGRLMVHGQFNDGTQSEMADIALLLPQDPAAIEVTGANEFRVLRPGRHVLIVRVRDQVTAVEVIRPLDEAELPRPIRSESAGTATRHTSVIDGAIEQRLKELGIEPLPRADVQTLFRRVTLDLTGRIPSEAQLRAFEAMAASSDQERLVTWIDHLLQSPESADYWSYWLAKSLHEEDLVGANQAEENAVAFRQYLRSHFVAGTPLAEIMAEMVEGSGEITKHPAAAFYQLANDGRSQTEVFSELVLGAQIGCANCHNHPLDHWTQDDYHGLAALFAGVQRGSAISWRPGAENIHPATGEPASACLPDGTRVLTEQDPRPALAHWIRGAGRTDVSRNWANRIWKSLMKVGLIEPIHDARVTNPPVNPELLEGLIDQWQQQGGSPQWLIREIVTSEAYQRRAVQVNPAGMAEGGLLAKASFAGRVIEPLTIAVYLDAICDVTTVRDLGATARDSAARDSAWRYIDRVDLGGAISSSAKTSGCTAGQVCPTDVADTLSGRLAEIAGEFINGRLSHPHSRVQAWAERLAGSPRETMRSIYRVCFTRDPTAEEEAFWLSEFSLANDDQSVIEDMVWSMLTSPEFSRN